MSLSSPVKARSAIDGGAANVRLQAQIDVLKTQRLELIRQHVALGTSQATSNSQSTEGLSTDSQHNGPEVGCPTDLEIADTVTSAQAVVKKHIKLLHDYNEIKDVATGLLALIAEQRGVRLVDIMTEFGAGGAD